MNDAVRTGADDLLARSAELEAARVALIESQTLRALVLVGAEGIGKTRLLKALVRKAREYPLALVVHLPCKSTRTRDAAATLLRLRELLSQQAEARQTKVRALAFDLAICRYTLLRFGLSAAKQLEEGLNTLSDPAYRNLLKIAAKASAAAGLTALHAAGLMPAVDKLLKKLFRMIRTSEAASKSSADPDVLKRLFELDENELEPLLPHFLAADIEDHLERNPNDRVWICLDDWGQLWGDEDYESRQLRSEREPRERALRELIEADSGARFVIVDRSPIYWEPIVEAQPRYRLVTLEPIPTPRADAYLQTQGLPPALAASVAEDSAGLPIWLTLAAKRYAELAKRGSVSASQLRRSGEDVVKVVGRGITQAELKTLEQLSTTVWFDEPLFIKLVAGTLVTGYPASAMREFVKLSFIETLGDGAYAVRDMFRAPLREALRASASPETWAMLHAIRREHDRSAGLTGAARAFIAGAESAVELVRGYAADRITAREFEDRLDELFRDGNPADVMRGALAHLRADLDAKLAAVVRAPLALTRMHVDDPYPASRHDDASLTSSDEPLSRSPYARALFVLAHGGWPEAQAALELAADAGDERAMALLGNMYWVGKGVVQDKIRAQALHEQAARLGYLPSMLTWAELELDSSWHAPDAQLAERLFAIAYQRGSARAAGRLAQLYGAGNGVAQDFSMARALAEEAADAGEVDGKAVLAVLLQEGAGGAADPARAFKLLREVGSSRGGAPLYHLGRAYEHGLGTPANQSKATDTYREAARLGFPLAAERLRALGVEP